MAILAPLAVAGGLGLGVAGLLRKNKTQGYSKGDLDYIAAVRAREIDNFSNQLTGLRTRYSAALANFGNYTFNRFVPQAEASFAGRGLNVTGGAFQSALARKAADIQQSEGLEMYNRERSDIGAVNDAWSALRAAQLGGGFSNMGGVAPDPTGEAMGMLSSALLSYGANAAGGGKGGGSKSSGVNGLSGKTSLFAPQPRRSIFADRVATRRDF